MTKHIHGGDVYKYKDCLDFSANLNPLGTPERVKQAIIRSLDHIAQYPRVGCGVLRERIAESEGVKMVIATIKHLFKKGKIYLIPKYVIDTGFKLIGYKLGRNYKKLPKWMVLKLTMNQTYWKA